MRKVKELTGLPVLSYDGGKRLGAVKDALFNPEYSRVLAFLIDDTGWRENAKVMPFQAVRSLGRDAVIVNSASDAVSIGQNEEYRYAFEHRKHFANIRVFTDDGRDLGTIGDVIVDEQTGDVKGFDVSGGIVSDTVKGRRFVPAVGGLKVGEDVAYVSSELGNEIEREARGGIQKQAGDAQRLGSEWAGRTREEAEKYGEQVRRGAARASERLRQATAENEKRFVTSRTSDRAVTAPDGRVIVERGDRVTREAAEDAERNGVLGELVIAVGGASVREVAEDLRDQAVQAFDEFRRAFADFRRGGQERGEQKRVDAALGRPVNRVVLDPQDNPILNRGDIVTHQAIQRAREAGVLDLLLSSVSPGEPGLGSEGPEESMSGETTGDGQPPEGLGEA